MVSACLPLNQADCVMEMEPPRLTYPHLNHNKKTTQIEEVQSTTKTQRVAVHTHVKVTKRYKIEGSVDQLNYMLTHSTTDSITTHDRAWAWTGPRARRCPSGRAWWGRKRRARRPASSWSSSSAFRV
jgi:hypothetical protein